MARTNLSPRTSRSLAAGLALAGLMIAAAPAMALQPPPATAPRSPPT